MVSTFTLPSAQGATLNTRSIPIHGFSSSSLALECQGKAWRKSMPLPPLRCRGNGPSCGMLPRLHLKNVLLVASRAGSSLNNRQRQHLPCKGCEVRPVVQIPAGRSEHHSSSSSSPICTLGRPLPVSCWRVTLCTCFCTLPSILRISSSGSTSSAAAHSSTSLRPSTRYETY